MQDFLEIFEQNVWMQILSYVLVFVAKMTEVSLATVRLVLINRGEKLKGALIGFFEVMIWAATASVVLGALWSDPIRLVVYCFAFSCGNYLGVIIEQKLAIGMACVQAIVSEEVKESLSTLLREHGFGVTVIQGEGKDSIVDVFLVYVKRKSVQEAISLVRSLSPTALVTINDVRHLRNGFMMK